MNILQAIKRGLKTTDKLLMSLCLLTSLFGVLMVYSATYSSLEDGSLISRTTLVMLLAVIVGVAMYIRTKNLLILLGLVVVIVFTTVGLTFIN